MEKDEIVNELFEALNERGITEETDDIETDKFCEMICNVLHSRTQAHVYHLQTESYSEHKALNDYYNDIVGLFDGIVESYQGKYGIIKNFKTFEVENYVDNSTTVEYFERLINIIEENRSAVSDSYIQNQIDTIIELIRSTMYKLKFLK
jgi:hypothetical protein